MIFFQNRLQNQNLGKTVEFDNKNPLVKEALSRSQSPETKFLFSSGGKFLQRPGDAKLRYVGGDTHIICLCNNITLKELLKKTLEICKEPHTIKYQLPDEDLDALISVYCEEDLQIMFEECSCTGDSRRLRIFLIPTIESESTGSSCITVQQYIAAVNGITGRSSTNNCNSQNHPVLSDEYDSPFPLPPPLVDMSDIIKPIRVDLLSQYDVLDKSRVGIPRALCDPKLPEQGENSAYCSQDGINQPDCLNFLTPQFSSSVGTTVFQDYPVQLHEDNDSADSQIQIKVQNADRSALHIEIGMQTCSLSSEPVSDELQPEKNDLKNHDFAFQDLLNGSGQPISILDMDTPLQYLQLFGPKQRSCDVNSQTNIYYCLAEEPMFKQSTTVDNPNRDSAIRGEVSLIDFDFPDSNLEDLRNDGEDKEDNDGGEEDIFNDKMIAEREACFCGLQIIQNADLEELRVLGCGSFGTVYHGKWRGTDVAIKKITKSCFTGISSEKEELIKDFWREAQTLSNLRHPNVLAFYGVVPDRPDGTLATVTEIMANGSLRTVLLKKHGSLDWHKKLTIAMDAAIGMEYLHSKNIVHFDLKCDNLLVNLRDPQRPICKVGDFGLSRIKKNTLISGGKPGTLPWTAPELFNGDSNRVSEKVDVYSFGITLWEILTEEEPYANMHYGEIIGGIVMNNLRPQIPKECDPQWRKLMEDCWLVEPEARPSFTHITNRLRSMSYNLRKEKENRNIFV